MYAHKKGGGVSGWGNGYLGVSRIVNIQPSRLAACASMPGTGVYMPPEAAQEEGVTRYNTAIDIFSFGVVFLLHTQKLPPKNIQPTNKDLPTRKIVGRSEIERREDYIVPMKAAFGETHPLVQLTLACLEFDQEDRPSAAVVLRGLEEVGTTLPQNCTQTKLELIQQVAVKDEEIQQVAAEKLKLLNYKHLTIVFKLRNESKFVDWKN